MNSKKSVIEESSARQTFEEGLMKYYFHCQFSKAYDLFLISAENHYPPALLLLYLMNEKTGLNCGFYGPKSQTEKETTWYKKKSL